MKTYAREPRRGERRAHDRDTGELMRVPFERGPVLRTPLPSAVARDMLAAARAERRVDGRFDGLARELDVDAREPQPPEPLGVDEPQPEAEVEAEAKPEAKAKAKAKEADDDKAKRATEASELGRPLSIARLPPGTHREAPGVAVRPLHEHRGPEPGAGDEPVAPPPAPPKEAPPAPGEPAAERAEPAAVVEAEAEAREAEKPKATPAPAAPPAPVGALPQPGTEDSREREEGEELDKAAKEGELQPKLEGDEDPEAEAAEPENVAEVTEVEVSPVEPGEGDPVAAEVALGGPEAAAAGPAPELEQWKQRADAAARNVPEPDLGPPENRTKTMAGHGTDTVKAGEQRRAELPKEAKPVFDPKPRDVEQIGQVADLLKEDPVGAAERIQRAAHKEGLPAQKLPNLQPTPKGHLPNLYGEPIAPEVFEELKQKYLPPESQRPPGFDEMAAILEKLKDEPDLDGRIAVFEGQTVSGAELPPQPVIAEAHQPDIAGVLARIITESEGLPQAWIDFARKKAYANGALANKECFPTLGNDWAPQEAEFLRGEMQRVREAAGISKEMLDEAIRDRQKQLAGDKTLAAQQGEKMFEDTKDKVEADYEKTHGLIEGLRQEWEDWADEQAAARKGGVDAKAVRARQRKIERAVEDSANDWIVAYDDMFKVRKQKLSQGYAEQEKAYKKAMEKDRELAIEEAREGEGDEATIEAKVEAIKKDKYYDDWVADRMKPVKELIESYVKTNDELYKGWQKQMRAVRDKALDDLQKWGDQQIGRQRTWFDRFLAWLFDWRDGQKSEARAFAKQRARETTVAMGSNLALLYQKQAEFGDALDADEKKQLEAMSEEQRTVIETYYTNGKDTIGAVAAGMKVRLRGQRVPVLVKAMVDHVMATPNNSPAGMKVVKLAEQLGERPIAAAAKAKSGFDHFWGTDEDKVFAALRMVSSPLGAKALRAAYWNRYHQDFDWRLKDELAGGWPDDDADHDKAKAILEQDKVGESAADLRRAVEGAGTNEALINEALRRFPPGERKAVLEEYERKYGENLLSRLDSELSGNEYKISAALAQCTKDGDAKADAVEIRDAQFAVMGPSRKDMEKVYARIREEEYRWAREEKEPPSSADIEKRIRDRQIAVAAQYKGEYKIELETAIKASFVLDPVAADLVIGLQKQDWKVVDAARLELERTGSYADDDTINDKVLRAGFDRAYERHKYDAEIQLMKEEQAHLEKHPDAGPWTAEYRLKRKEALLAEARTKAETESVAHLAELKTYYIDTYGGRIPLWQTRGKTGADAFDALIRDLTQGAGETEARDRLQYGGYLPVERELHHAIKDGDKDTIKAQLNGKSKEEVDRIRKLYEATYKPPPSFDDAVLGELSGRDKNDMKIQLEHGEPTDPATALKVAEAKLEYERRTGGERMGVKRERFQDLEFLVDRLRVQKKEYEDNLEASGGVLTDPDTGATYFASPSMGAYQNSWQAGLASVNEIVEVHRQEVDAEADLISGLVAMVVAVVVGALLAPFTAGASLGLILLVAGAIAATATAATMLTKWALKGDAYSKDEMLMDAAFGVVDFVVTAVTLGAGKFIAPMLKGGMKAAQAGKTTVREAFKAAVGRSGKQLWTQGVKRAAIHQAETEAVQGLFSTLAVPAFMDEYGKGMNPLASTLLTLGLTMGGGIMVGKGMHAIQHARPARFDFEAHARSHGDGADLVDLRSDPHKLSVLQDAYLKDNPHKLPSDFLSDYDDILLKLMKDPDVKARWQQRARGDMLAAIPEHQRAQFVETPIELMSDKDFRRLTGSRSKGEAVVMIKDGKPTVVVRQGASPSALRREAAHLLQAVDPRWKPHIKLLDEANLQGWHAKDVREKLRLYGAKLELEIDAARSQLAGAKAQARRAKPPAGIAREVAEAEETLRNLLRRKGEVDRIGPLRRTLMAWGLYPEPRYLKEKPRLFSKRGKGGEGGIREPGEPSGVERGPPKGGPAEEPPQRVILEPFAGPSLESPMELAARHPDAKVIATEASIHPAPAEVQRLQAAGGAFVPDNMPSSIPVGSVDEIKMRFPLPHDTAVQQGFSKRLTALEKAHPNASRVELGQQALAEAAQAAESATAYGPYALQRLKSGGSLEVVFWEKRIRDELEALTELRFIDPATGKGYRFELEHVEMRPKGELAPHSGFGVPVTNADPVHVARLKKVELDSALPTGARGGLRPGEVVGTHSGRSFFPERAGGPVRKLDYSKIKLTTRGIDVVDAHIRRFGGGGDMELAMVDRLRRIARGEIEATDFDRAFYSHELRESVRYRKRGWRTGQPADEMVAYDLWNDLHTATLEDYGLREFDASGRRTLFHPDLAETPATKPTGGRGPMPPERIGGGLDDFLRLANEHPHIFGDVDFRAPPAQRFELGAVASGTDRGRRVISSLEDLELFDEYVESLRRRLAAWPDNDRAGRRLLAEYVGEYAPTRRAAVLAQLRGGTPVPPPMLASRYLELRRPFVRGNAANPEVARTLDIVTRVPHLTEVNLTPKRAPGQPPLTKSGRTRPDQAHFPESTRRTLVERGHQGPVSTTVPPAGDLPPIYSYSTKSYGFVTNGRPHRRSQIEAQMRQHLAEAIESYHGPAYNHRPPVGWVDSRFQGLIYTLDDVGIRNNPALLRRVAQAAQRVGPDQIFFYSRGELHSIDDVLRMLD